MGYEAEVTIKGKVEGLDQMDADLGRLASRMASMNQSASGDGLQMSTPMGMPSTAPAEAVRAPDPLEGYAQNPRIGMDARFPAPSLGYTPPPWLLQPGALAPQPIATSPIGSGSGQVVNVNIVGASHTVPVSFAGIPGGGGSTPSGGGASGGGGGGGGGVGPGEGAPPDPGNQPGGGDEEEDDRESRWSRKPSFKRFLRSMSNNPTIGGIANAALNELPLGPTIAVGVAGAAASYAAGISRAMYTPAFNTETSFMTAAAAGQYIGRGTSAAMSRATGLETDLGVSRAEWGPVTSIPIVGGAINSVLDMYTWMPMQRQIEVAKAKGQADDLRLLLGSYGSVSDRFNGTDSAVGDEYLTGRAGALRSLSPFGRSSIDFLMSSNMYSRADSRGITGDSLNGSISTISSIAQDPQYAALWGELSKGNFIGADVIKTSAREMAYQGNLQGVASLLPAVNTADTDGSLKKFYDEMLQLARQIGQINLSISVAQNQIASAASNAQIVSYGGTYSEIATATRGELAPMQTTLMQLAKKYSLANTDAERSEIQKHMDAVSAQLIATTATITQEENQGLVVTTGAARTAATTALTVATMAGGGIGTVIPALAGDIQAQSKNLDARKKALEANRPYMNADEYGAQKSALAQEEVSIGIRTARELPQAEYDIRTSEIGTTAASVQSGMTAARLFGSVQDIYTASQRQVTDVISPSIDATTNFLRQHGLTNADMSGVVDGTVSVKDLEQSGRVKGMTVQELTNAINKLIGAVTEEVTASTQNTRTLNASNFAIASMTQTITQTRGQMVLQFGAPDAGTIEGVYSANVAAAGNSAEKKRAERDNGKYKVGSPDWLRLDSEYQSLVLAQTSTIMADTQPSFGVRSGLQTAGIIQSIGSTGFVPYGVMRQALAGGMQAAGQDVGEAQHAYQLRLEEIKKLPIEAQEGAREEARLRLQHRIGGDLAQEGSFYQQMQEGWQGRLTSALLGAPGRASWVTANFNNRTAAPHMQRIAGDPEHGVPDVYPGDWGFSGGAEGDAARSMNLFRLPRLFSALQLPGSGEGIVAGGLSAVPPTSGGRHGMLPTLVPPGHGGSDIQLNITLVPNKDGTFSGKATVKASDVAAAQSSHQAAVPANFGQPWLAQANHGGQR